MKIAICGDVHFSQYSSIVRKRGTEYSMRLENLIKSINWFQDLSVKEGCSYNFYLGDFFDKPECNAEELSALSKIQWNTLPHIFLCGNHEMGRSDHAYSSAKLFGLVPNASVIDKPAVLNICDNLEICMLPYMLETTRKDIVEYLPEKIKPRLIFSHNDLKDFQMGAFKSEIGFSLSEIEQNCDLFINGHLHNGGKVTSKIINIGNLTGQNFSEDASRYEHSVFILDTNTLSYKVFVNPYAFNFYKLSEDYVLSTKLASLKNQAVVSIDCSSGMSEQIRTIIEDSPKVVESHLVVHQTTDENFEETQPSRADLSINHLEAFRNYILATFENTLELKQELSEVIK